MDPSPIEQKPKNEMTEEERKKEEEIMKQIELNEEKMNEIK
jgi:hypothetical protein